MSNRFPPQRRRISGFSLVEMMVAITVGLVLISVMAVVYINSKASTRQVDQLSALQQNVRTAFEYLAFDGRMVGHLGCFTRHEGLIPVNAMPTLEDNFALGIEGYEFTGTAPGDSLAIPQGLPVDTVTATAWTNSDKATTPGLPLGTISGGAAIGLTPGSDVLIMRSASVGRPVRLTAPVAIGATTLTIETGRTGTCPDGSANVQGFCNGSFGVVAGCTAAQAFKVANRTAGTLTLTGAVTGTVAYAPDNAEVFPMRTIVYYVKRSSSGTTTSLYRRILDGAQADVTIQEQELIENVENMQVRYGLDTTLPVADGLIDGDYVPASATLDWGQVVAVRISLLLRAPLAVDANMAPTTGISNGLTLTYPTGAGVPRFDRRVFTTTVALRNRIAYAAPP